MPEEQSGQDLPYTNREQREKWHDVQGTLQVMGTNIEVGFREVKSRQDIANGRVTKLELDKSEKAGFYKAMTIAGAIGWSVVFSLVCWILLQIVNLDSKINTATHQAVDDALQAYEINPAK